MSTRGERRRKCSASGYPVWTQIAKQTVYEVEIPWNAVGIDQPERLKQFRMSLIVNDCDNGKTRENSILVSDGVMGNKEVKRIDTFPVVDLMPRR